MRKEIAAAAGFLTEQLTAPPSSVTQTQAERFASSLRASLELRYVNHWHLNDAERGSAYRSLSRSGPTHDTHHFDTQLIKAAQAAELPVETVAHQLLRLGERWTLWVDPDVVLFRQGESNANTFREIYPAPGRSSLPSSSSARSLHAIVRSFSLCDIDAALETKTDTASAVASPSKKSRAIQIIDPSTRRESPKPLTDSLITITAAAASSSDVSTSSESTTTLLPAFVEREISPRSSLDTDSIGSTPLLGFDIGSPLSEASSLMSDTSSMLATPSLDLFARPCSRTSTLSRTSSASGSVDIQQSWSQPPIARKESSPEYDGEFALPLAPASQYNSETYAIPVHAPRMNIVRSAPGSPNKARRQRGHLHSASMTSNASSSSNHSSSTSVRSSNTGVVVEHSNGKVGVLGGGVLLGMPNGSQIPKRARGTRTRSRSKSRTTSFFAAAAAAGTDGPHASWASLLNS
ncbi:uncharacterized protein L969DRAFT_16342 [Mixia osmundae IAM 14324]|uniref:Anti-proliferative protein domain-containing protein n=1 Tax=Mixia osmundae (strain CBS 9802 / IAM 14324 / JCM 22182 / KY 12970) TaxID=764103 RepID=G7DU63_MIXOS|nr:uncharacterized protein L969DRAFT_16342 [Mixia osmundae IAM 14324]KEI40990.1 hypothetical protein L969DRAFT_16342 [Mixia osmundae IAM 14324]GAA94123.1 hypothetical protein E5Q_00771 [Mixia osmundae IAM 14324]